jgi:hypothetical protein
MIVSNLAASAVGTSRNREHSGPPSSGSGVQLHRAAALAWEIWEASAGSLVPRPRSMIARRFSQALFAVLPALEPRSLVAFS